MGVECGQMAFDAGMCKRDLRHFTCQGNCTAFNMPTN